MGARLEDGGHEERCFTPYKWYAYNIRSAPAFGMSYICEADYKLQLNSFGKRQEKKKNDLFKIKDLFLFLHDTW